jgi:putative transposase
MRGFRHWRGQLDEMYVKLNGKIVYVLRAVDRGREILESDITITREKYAAFNFMKKELKLDGKPGAIPT